MQALSRVTGRPGWIARRDRLHRSIRQAHEVGTPLIMGIVNVTPDSFSDGGHHNAPDAACDHAARLVSEGAALLDIGGESTRPGAVYVPAAEELARTRPVIARFATECPVSIDTYKACVAEGALREGAVMVNDVWGLQRDPAMAPLLAGSGALAVLMHNREEIDPSLDMRDEFRRSFDRILRDAEHAGIPRSHIVLDPGIGFGKTDRQNLDSIRSIAFLRTYYDLPVLLGLSRKSLFGRLLGRDVDDRLAGTIAANLAGMVRGAAVLRVHDVAAHVDAVRIMALLHDATGRNTTSEDMARKAASEKDSA